ncbi:translation initiation factor IF3-4, chloroplastic-like isoform X1 [Syzygium oleosum]|uniref:translation initiation factor IF3-4, chloroplastic-like isoform X1 n=1 Tax=Syzygium oleosum TaxID=219896 RepID=UPI0011D1B520|nr:translation initiation factor IF3-4, chloroplastic-like isoform X1 [Syzygium oleosum]
MAAVTGGFAFKPILASSKATSAAAAAAAVSPPFSLSSLESSKLFGVRLSEAGSLTTRCSLVLAPCGRSVACRYGGGGGGGGGSRYSGSGDWRRSRQSDSDDDQALDVSTIRSATVRLIDQQQNMVGVVSKSEAIRMAEDAELDLVILSPDADPPVVRIMDYRKFKYEQQKKKREQQKKSAASRMDMKELKMGYNIDQHDYSVRLKAARKFLKDGDKVKVIVNLKGRENDFRNIAIELIRRFQNDVGELATEESKNFRERNMSIVLVPNKAVLQKVQDPPKKQDKSSANEVSASI